MIIFFLMLVMGIISYIVIKPILDKQSTENSNTTSENSSNMLNTIKNAVSNLPINITNINIPNNTNSNTNINGNTNINNNNAISNTNGNTNINNNNAISNTNGNTNDNTNGNKNTNNNAVSNTNINNNTVSNTNKNININGNGEISICDEKLNPLINQMNNISSISGSLSNSNINQIEDMCLKGQEYIDLGCDKNNLDNYKGLGVNPMKPYPYKTYCENIECVKKMNEFMTIANEVSALDIINSSNIQKINNMCQIAEEAINVGCNKQDLLNYVGISENVPNPYPYQKFCEGLDCLEKKTELEQIMNEVSNILGIPTNSDTLKIQDMCQKGENYVNTGCNENDLANYKGLGVNPSIPYPYQKYCSNLNCELRNIDMIKKMDEVSKIEGNPESYEISQIEDMCQKGDEFVSTGCDVEILNNYKGLGVSPNTPFPFKTFCENLECTQRKIDMTNRMDEVSNIYGDLNDTHMNKIQDMCQKGQEYKNSGCSEDYLNNYIGLGVSPQKPYPYTKYCSNIECTQKEYDAKNIAKLLSDKNQSEIHHYHWQDILNLCQKGLDIESSGCNIQSLKDYKGFAASPRTEYPYNTYCENLECKQKEQEFMSIADTVSTLGINTAEYNTQLLDNLCNKAQEMENSGCSLDDIKAYMGNHESENIVYDYPYNRFCPNLNCIKKEFIVEDILDNQITDYNLQAQTTKIQEYCNKVKEMKDNNCDITNVVNKGNTSFSIPLYQEYCGNIDCEGEFVEQGECQISDCSGTGQKAFVWQSLKGDALHCPYKVGDIDWRSCIAESCVPYNSPIYLKVNDSYVANDNGVLKVNNGLPKTIFEFIPTDFDWNNQSNVGMQHSIYIKQSGTGNYLTFNGDDLILQEYLGIETNLNKPPTFSISSESSYIQYDITVMLSGSGKKIYNNNGLFSGRVLTGSDYNMKIKLSPPVSYTPPTPDMIPPPLEPMTDLYAINLFLNYGNYQFRYSNGVVKPDSAGLSESVINQIISDNPTEQFYKKINVSTYKFYKVIDKNQMIVAGKAVFFCMTITYSNVNDAWAITNETRYMNNYVDPLHSECIY